MDNSKTLQIVRLTDDELVELSGDRVLTDSRDFNLRYKELTAWEGGVYDPKIFGSFYKNRCACRTRKTYGKCDICHTENLPEEQKYLRFARIEIPFYYLNTLKADVFKNLVKEIFLSVKEVKMETTSMKALDTKTFDMCQFDYDPNEQIITISEIITDIRKASYEGLLLMAETYFDPYYLDLLNLLNKNVIVLPPIMRMFTRIPDTNEMAFPELTRIYQSLLFLKTYVSQAEMGYPDLTEKVRIRALLRRFAAETVLGMTDILNSSKENATRQMYSSRVDNSGRAVIVADPTLKIDEISLPFHLAYEAFKEDFMKHLIDSNNHTKNEALLVYNAGSKVTLDEFREWVSNRSVTINRNPTLHEFNILSMKVRLNSNYTIGLPLMVCKPLNADFDGDTISFIAIPEDEIEAADRRMSPKNLVYYKKNDILIFLPSQETLNGLNIATILLPTDPTRTFKSLEDAEKLIPQGLDEKDIIIIDGKTTSIYREQISKILGFDVNQIIGEERINSKWIVDIVAKLNEDPLRTEKLRDLQNFGLEVVTVEGVTSLDLNSIYNTYKEEFDASHIIDDPNLSNEEKISRVDTLYKEYLNKRLDELDESLKDTISASDKIRMSSLMSIINPQIYIDADQNMTVTKKSIAKGMSFEDTVDHALENRFIMDIKKRSVPLSGYLDRQGSFAAYAYKFSDQKDPENKGILIPADRAKGRTLVNGKIYKGGAKGEWVRVRSLITGTIPNVATADCYNLETLDVFDGDNLGISFMTSIVENLTQSGLSLKHGGRLFEIDRSSVLRAPFDCRIELDKDWVTFIGKGLNSRVPRPNKFQIFEGKKSFKKGDIVGWIFKLVNPSYNLDSLIKLLGANSSKSTKKHEKNVLNIQDCYSITDGPIYYTIEEDHVIAMISGSKHVLSKDTLLLFPEGSHVNKGDRISSGVVDLPLLLGATDDLDLIYRIFRDQYITLMGMSIREEMMEFLFTVICKSETPNELNYMGIAKKARSNKSFFSLISFERASQVVKSAIKS